MTMRNFSNKQVMSEAMDTRFDNTTMRNFSTNKKAGKKQKQDSYATNMQNEEHYSGLENLIRTSQDNLICVDNHQ